MREGAWPINFLLARSTILFTAGPTSLKFLPTPLIMKLDRESKRKVEQVRYFWRNKIF